MLIQLELQGSPHVGVFARSSDELVLLPTPTAKETMDRVAKALDASAAAVSIGGSTILGACVALNRHGAVLADFADAEEAQDLRERGLEVGFLGGHWNAAGNNILVNDHGAIVHPDLDEVAVEEIARVLAVPVARGTVAGHKTVGSAALATNKGVLCHPKVSEPEIELIERALKVSVEIGTVNHGVPYIGAGLIANSKGAAIGKLTTGPEMNRIEDALGYF